MEKIYNHRISVKHTCFVYKLAEELSKFTGKVLQSAQRKKVKKYLKINGEINICVGNVQNHLLQNPISGRDPRILAPSNSNIPAESSLQTAEIQQKNRYFAADARYFEWPCFSSVNLLEQLVILNFKN
jgi:hypothetical protein